MTQIDTAAEVAAATEAAADASAAPEAPAAPTQIRNALLLFSKPPIPGLVKTRLTTEFGGFMTPELAAQFFRVCLYDVTECAMHALILLQAENEAEREADPDAPVITYDFFLSTTPAENVELMREVYDKIGPWPMEIHYLVDSGATFDDHFDDAIKQIFDMGYDNIVSIGADIPTMPRSHINQAFSWLNFFQMQGTPGFVQAPCQECGTSLIGLNRDTPINNQGIYYNMDGRPALDGYVEKLKETGVPNAYFSPVADIDEITDLAHAISCMQAMEMAGQWQPDIFVPRRVLGWVRMMGIRVTTPPNENHDPRQYLDGEEPEDGAEDGATDGAADADGGDAAAGEAGEGIDLSALADNNNNERFTTNPDGTHTARQ